MGVLGLARFVLLVGHHCAALRRVVVSVCHPLRPVRLLKGRATSGGPLWGGDGGGDFARGCGSRAEELGGGFAGGFVGARDHGGGGFVVVVVRAVADDVEEAGGGGDPGLGLDEALAEFGELGEGVEFGSELLEIGQQLLGGAARVFAELEDAELGGEEVCP